MVYQDLESQVFKGLKRVEGVRVIEPIKDNEKRREYMNISSQDFSRFLILPPGRDFVLAMSDNWDSLSEFYDLNRLDEKLYLFSCSSQSGKIFVV